MKMALMKTCCCFQKLSNACKATAIFTIVVAVLGIIWHLSSIFSRTIPYWSTGLALTLYLVAAVLDSLLLLGGVLLLTGAFKGYSGRYFVLAFILFMAVYLVIDISCGIASYYVIHVDKTFGSDVWKSLAVIISLVIWIIPLPFFVIGEIVAISFFQELREKRMDLSRNAYVNSYLFGKRHAENGNPYLPPRRNNGPDRHHNSNFSFAPNPMSHYPSDFNLPRKVDRFGDRVSFSGGYGDIYRQYNSDPGYRRHLTSLDREDTFGGSRFRDSLGLYGRPYVNRPNRLTSLFGSSYRPSALARDYF